MTKFFLSVAEISLTMSAVILLLLLLFRLFGKRMKAKSRYIVWVLILVRLAIPIGIPGMPALFTVELSVPSEADPELPVIESNAVDPDISALPQTEPLHTLESQTATPVESVKSAQSADPSEGIGKVLPEESVGVSFFASTKTTLQKVSLEDWLWLAQSAYLLMVFALFSGSLFAHLLYVHRIKKGRTLGEEKIYPLYVEVCRNKGIADPPLLWVSRAADSPMIIGLLTPRLILPENIKESALDGMLAHELKHYTRRDLWVKFICMAARSLHWFNPLVHIAAALCMQEMELSCDDEVLVSCSLEERIKYGNAMLEVVRNCQNKGISLTTHFSPKKSAVKARFSGIVDMHKKKSGTWLIVLASLLCIISGTVLAYTLNFDAAAKEHTPTITDVYHGDTFTVTEYTTADTSRNYWTVLLANGQTLLHTPDTSVSYRPNIDTIVSFEDVNFDRKQDLLLCKGGYGAYGSVYYDCYLYSGERYVLCESFSEIPNPVVDAEKNLIISTYRQSGSMSLTAAYVYKDSAFFQQERSKTGEDIDIVYFTDFSNPDVLRDFVAFRGTWAVNDGRLWLVSVDTANDTLAQMSALLLYTGDRWRTLTDYQVDVDIYNVQTQTGVLTRCDLDQVSSDSAEASCSISANAFYGYFQFVSKTGTQGALAYGCTHGEWGGNLVVEEGEFAPGDDIHLCAIVSGDELRCIYTDLETGAVLLDISCEFDYWEKGTFGLRMLASYEGNVSLGYTSFDNLRVKRLP